MRTLLAALALASATLASGCLCGGWDGENDTMLRSTTTNDAILVCGNGGFSAMLADGSFVEGWASESYDENGVVTYSYIDGETSATVTFPGTFEERSMDQVERDHANVLCVDLESRGWWVTAQ